MTEQKLMIKTKQKRNSKYKGYIQIMNDRKIKKKKKKNGNKLKLKIKFKNTEWRK